MKGAILEKEGQTYLKEVFKAVNDVQRDYNWLITDCECGLNVYNARNYGWLSGDELTDMVEQNDSRWIWGVLSGFDKKYKLKEILMCDLPYADGYRGFWQNPVSIQHPMASIEIVAWDGSSTLFISRDDRIADDFLNALPSSRNLELYNERTADQSDEYAEWLRKGGI